MSERHYYICDWCSLSVGVKPMKNMYLGHYHARPTGWRIAPLGEGSGDMCPACQKERLGSRYTKEEPCS